MEPVPPPGPPPEGRVVRETKFVTTPGGGRNRTASSHKKFSYASGVSRGSEGPSPDLSRSPVPKLGTSPSPIPIAPMHPSGTAMTPFGTLNLPRDDEAGDAEYDDDPLQSFSAREWTASDVPEPRVWMKGLPTLECPSDLSFFRKHAMVSRAQFPRISKLPVDRIGKPKTPANSWPASARSRGDWRSELGRRNVPTRQRTAAELVSLCKSELQESKANLVQRVLMQQPARRRVSLLSPGSISAVFLDEQSQSKFKGDTEEELAQGRQLKDDVGRMKRWVEPGATELNLANTVSSARQIRAMTAAIAATPTITHVNLSQNNLTDDLITSNLNRAVRTSKQLTVLDLSNNRLRDMEWISGLLLRPATAISRSQTTRAMEKVILHGNRLGDHGARQLAEALERNVLLSTLDISKCAISDQGAAAIGVAMGENNTITELDISWNLFGAKGAMALAEGVRANRWLKTFNISNNGIGDEGGSYIAEVLLHNDAITRLDLSSTRIGSQSCQVLATALPKNRVLQTLLLNDNALGRNGARAVVRSLTDMCDAERDGERQEPIVITRLSLHGCSFQDQDKDAAELAVITFKPSDPDGLYDLKLDNPAHHAVAVELVKLWNRQGHGCWRNCKLGGRFFEMSEGLGWPERLPAAGRLSLEFASRERVSPDIEPIPDKVFNMLWSDLDHTQLIDEWRLEMVRVLASDVYFTALQTGAMLRCFTWNGPMKQEAARAMFPRITDPANIAHMTEALTESEREDLLESLGIMAKFHWANPSGSYSLDLSRQVDYSIAWRLMTLAEQEWHKYNGWFPLRNVVFNGAPLLVEKPTDFRPPGEGKLECDFASVIEVTEHTGNQLTGATFRELCRVLLKEGPLDHRKELRELAETARKDHLQRRVAQRLNRFNAMQASASTQKKKESRVQSRQASPSKQERAGPRVVGVKKMRRSVAAVKGSLRMSKEEKKRREREEREREFKALDLESRYSDPRWRPWVEDLQDIELVHSGMGFGTVECIQRRRSIGLMADHGEMTIVKELVSAAERGVEEFRKASLRRSISPGRSLKLPEPRDWKRELEDRMLFLGRVAVSHTLSASALEALMYVVRFWPAGQHRMVDLMVMWWARCVDRHSYPEILPRSVNPSDHSRLCRKLGWMNVINFRRPDAHFDLRLDVREEYDVAWRLCQIAVFSPKEKNWRSLVISGTPIQDCSEDAAFWHLLTGYLSWQQLIKLPEPRVLNFDFVTSRYVYTLTAILQIQTFFRRWRTEQRHKQLKRATNFIKRRYLLYRVRKAGLLHIEEAKIWERNWEQALRDAEEAERIAEEAERTKLAQAAKSKKLQEKMSKITAVRKATIMGRTGFRPPPSRG